MAVEEGGRVGGGGRGGGAMGAGASTSKADSAKDELRMSGVPYFGVDGERMEAWSAVPVSGRSAGGAADALRPSTSKGQRNIVFVLGGPGSGKGTQCERIVRDYGYKHLSAGDLLREEVASCSSLGTELQAIMKEGKLVPMEVTIGLLRKAMDKSGASDFLIDGFPRALDQALEFEKQVGMCSKVLFFDCPKDVMRERLLARGKTSGRADDNEETIVKRFDTFVNQSMPVIDHYRSRGGNVVASISAVPPPDAVYEAVKEALGAPGSSAQAVTRVVGTEDWYVRGWYYGAPSLAPGRSGTPKPEPMGADAVRSPDGKNGGAPLRIVHFNDVYEVAETKGDLCGGPKRFSTVVKNLSAPELGPRPLLLFSGDALNPSLLSTSTKGQHMIDILNRMGTCCSVVGNHDLDFGVENLNEKIQSSKFPWLCSNCWHKDTGEPLAGAREYAILEHEGYRVGVVGLIEEDWLVCCATLDATTVDVADFVDVGRRLATKLRTEAGCDFVVALSHFREPNDERLAREAPEIDVVLGGHDHHYATACVEPHGTHYVKSGADFKHASLVTLTPVSGQRVSTTVEKHDVVRSLQPDPRLGVIVDPLIDGMATILSRVIGHLDTEIDARFAEIRTRETNLGTFVADIMRHSVLHVPPAGNPIDIALCNSGTLRADVVFPKGDFTIEDLYKLLPFTGNTLIKGVSGKDMISVLENSVYGWPKKEGRFLQVSGITFAFDGSLPPGDRVDVDSIKVQGARLELDRIYNVIGPDFMMAGNEGFDAFKTSETLVDEENAPVMQTMITNYLFAIKILNESEMAGGSAGDGGIISRFTPITKDPFAKEFENQEDVLGQGARRMRKWIKIDKRKAIHVKPMEEGRIVNTSPNV